MEKHIVSTNRWKQYSYEKGMAKLSEIDQLKLELRRKEVELEILKNTRNWKEVSPQAVVKLVEELKGKYTVHLICFFALMYPYLPTTDGKKRKTFLQPLSRKLLVNL